ncbi:hypothetical protein [Marivirga sp.]|uniref:hypothetical protein n=1 Tax=Marivirga sp. TaxID=2018662 RepID=UPI003DA73B8F
MNIFKALSEGNGRISTLKHHFHQLKHLNFHGINAVVVFGLKDVFMVQEPVAHPIKFDVTKQKPQRSLVKR